MLDRAWTGFIAAGGKLDIAESYMASIGMVLVDRLPGYVVLAQFLRLYLTLVPLSEGCLPLRGERFVCVLLVDGAECALVYLALVHLLKSSMVMRYERLVYLSLVDLLHLTWKDFGLADRDVPVNVAVRRARVAVHDLICLHLILFYFTDSRSGCLVRAKRDTAIHIFLIHLYETAIGTRNPMPRRQDLDVFDG
jgi:hypothetical protein